MTSMVAASDSEASTPAANPHINWETERVTLLGTPYPDECGYKMRNGDECAREVGHTGRHDGEAHPDCDTCGATERLDRRGYFYTCSHAHLDRERLQHAYSLHPVRKQIAYALAGYPRSGRAPYTEQYDLAQVVCIALDRAGMLSDEGYFEYVDFDPTAVGDA